MEAPDAGPLVSVVTPFYNSADHLAECIESVLRQEDVDFEYILVDNQSTDGSDEIAMSYAARDPRIRVVTTERFLTQVENYNFALRQIAPTSRWCKICQADDWLYPRCLREMVDVGESSPGIGIVSSYSWRGDEVLGMGLPPDVSGMSGRDACRLHLLGPLFLFGSPSTVMYRSDVVRSRAEFYELGRLHEDTEACFEILADTDFGFVHQVLSYRRVDPSSISGRTSDLLDRQIDRLTIVLRYGPTFLTGPEFQACRENALNAYYRRLGQRLLRGFFTGTNNGLLAYQRRGLALVGESLSARRVARGVGKVLVETALSPAEAFRLYRRQALAPTQRIALEDR